MGRRGALRNNAARGAGKFANMNLLGPVPYLCPAAWRKLGCPGWVSGLWSLSVLEVGRRYWCLVSLIANPQVGPLIGWGCPGSGAVTLLPGVSERAPGDQPSSQLREKGPQRIAWSGLWPLGGPFSTRDKTWAE